MEATDQWECSSVARTEKAQFSMSISFVGLPRVGWSETLMVHGLGIDGGQRGRKR